MTKLRAGLLLFPLAFASGVSWHLFSVSAQAPGLRVEGLSLTSSDVASSRQVTVTFRIVNDGAAVTTPFRTAIAVDAAVESPIAFVGTTSLRPGATFYVSRTFTVADSASGVDVRVEADVDGAVPGDRSQLVVVGHVPVGPPVPGRWFPIGPYHVEAPAASGFGEYHAVGRLGPIAVHPSNPQIIYVGSAGQLGREGCGVWKTTNGGISWFPITDGLPSLAVAAIALDPTDPNRVYIALVGTGVFRSDDGATSWTLLSEQPSVKRVRHNSFDGDLTVLLVDPNHPATLYLTSDSGVLRSDDGGSTWQTSLGGGPGTALVMDPFDSNLLYAAIQGQGVYRTTDGGKLGWTPQTLPGASNLSPFHGIRLALAHPPTALHEIVYALVGSETDPKGYRLYRSRDGGVTWNGRFKCDTTTSPPGDCEFWVMVADPAGTHLYLAGPLFWISSDGGAVFDRMPATGNDRLPASGHGDYHGLALNPIDPSTVFANSDGGIYKSSDHAAEGTWSFIGAGIANAEIYDLAIAPTLPGRLIAGTQDNGTIEYNGSVTWDHIFPVPPSPFGGDGGIVAIDPVDPDVFYNTEQDQQSVRRSADGGQSWSDFNNGLPLKSAVVCTPFIFFNTLLFHFQVHPNNSNVLLASCLSLWRTTTTTPPDWKFRFAAPQGVIVRSAIAPGDVYYVGTAATSGVGGGEVHTAVGGVNWQNIFTHPQALDVSDIEIDPARPELVYVSFAPGPGQFRNCANGTPLPDGAFSNGTGEGRIYQLRRGPSRGAPVSVDLTSDTVGGLPLNLCVAAIAIDPVIPQTIYAATNRGVYRGHGTAGSSAWTWTPYNEGLPPAGPDVRDLEVHPTTRHMIAATYGRSAFEVILHGLQRLPF